MIVNVCQNGPVIEVCNLGGISHILEVIWSACAYVVYQSNPELLLLPMLHPKTLMA